jgi:hypothetical protein
MRQRRDTMEAPTSRVVSTNLLDRFNFPSLCDLFRLSDIRLIPGATLNPSGIQVGDSTYQIAQQNVPVFFSPAPENDQPTVMGRVSADNIYTLDKFVIPSGIEVHDAWVLVFLSAGDNYREVYSVQGEPRAMNPHPFHRAQQQTVLCKKLPSSPLPSGVYVRNPLGLS